MPMPVHLQAKVGSATSLYLYFIADGPPTQYVLEIDIAFLIYKIHAKGL